MHIVLLWVDQALEQLVSPAASCSLVPCTSSFCGHSRAGPCARPLRAEACVLPHQVTTPGNAARLGVDFADYYEASALRE